jgi:hypothetical protein
MLLQPEQMHKMAYISHKMVKFVILIENSCHFVSCSAGKLFSSQLEISHMLNGTTPKIQYTENEDLKPKSLCRSCIGRHFYGTENVIWAGFGPIGNTEKKVWADYEQLLRTVFSCFWVQKNYKKFV